MAHSIEPAPVHTWCVHGGGTLRTRTTCGVATTLAPPEPSLAVDAELLCACVHRRLSPSCPILLPRQPGVTSLEAEGRRRMVLPPPQHLAVWRGDDPPPLPTTGARLQQRPGDATRVRRHPRARREPPRHVRCLVLPSSSRPGYLAPSEPRGFTGTVATATAAPGTAPRNRQACGPRVRGCRGLWCVRAFACQRPVLRPGSVPHAPHGKQRGVLCSQLARRTLEENTTKLPPHPHQKFQAWRSPGTPSRTPVTEGSSRRNGAWADPHTCHGAHSAGHRL